jgi:methionyl-tRNA formyltransferase
VWVCGKKTVAERCLQLLHEHPGVTVVGCATEAGDWQADCAAWAGARGIPVHTGNVNALHAEVAAAAPDFLFSIQYGPLIRAPILALPPRGAFNLHFGLLPEYSGCYPVAWALLNGETEAGVTLHHMTEAFDAGDVVARATSPITPATTARALFDALTEAAVDLFRRQLPRLLDDTAERRPQDSARKQYYDKSSIDFERDRWIDWSAPAEQVRRRIQAFTFPPFQEPASRTHRDGAGESHVRLGQAAVVAGAAGEPGQCLGLTPARAVRVVCGSGAIDLSELDGIPAADWVAQLGAAPETVRFGSGVPQEAP